MAKSTGFQFKQFFIAHDKCAMKVNTDSIILGSLVNTAQCKQILDLGTGSGLLAIMLAQRTAYDCQITAVELEQNAFIQATENIHHSPWADRITPLQADILQLTLTDKFDLIVSNPPYFEHSLATRSSERDLARNTTQSHFTWLEQAKKWLKETGRIAFILPTETSEKLIQQAKYLNLHCVEKWNIITKEGKKPKRSITIFSQQMIACIEKELIVYQSNNEYTQTFKDLTKDFYLNG
ncbi:tRNA1(Val) (adenine(37)-N6)-methyltransferase [Ursidibacter sp. B-7004-1]